jgi:hypothetical protein
MGGLKSMSNVNRSPREGMDFDFEPHEDDDKDSITGVYKGKSGVSIIGQKQHRFSMFPNEENKKNSHRNNESSIADII